MFLHLIWFCRSFLSRSSRWAANGGEFLTVSWWEKTAHLYVEESFGITHCTLERCLAWGHGRNVIYRPRLVSSKWFVRLFRLVLPAAPGLPRLSCWHPDETANRGQHSKSATAAQTHVQQCQQRAKRRRALIWTLTTKNIFLPNIPNSFNSHLLLFFSLYPHQHNQCGTKVFD